LAAPLTVLRAACRPQRELDAPGTQFQFDTEVSKESDSASRGIDSSIWPHRSSHSAPTRRHPAMAAIGRRSDRRRGTRRLRRRIPWHGLCAWTPFLSCYGALSRGPRREPGLYSGMNQLSHASSNVARRFIAQSAGSPARISPASAGIGYPRRRAGKSAPIRRRQRS